MEGARQTLFSRLVGEIGKPERMMLSGRWEKGRFFFFLNGQIELLDDPSG